MERIPLKKIALDELIPPGCRISAKKATQKYKKNKCEVAQDALNSKQKRRPVILLKILFLSRYFFTIRNETDALKSIKHHIFRPFWSAFPNFKKTRIFLDMELS